MADAIRARSLDLRTDRFMSLIGEVSITTRFHLEVAIMSRSERIWPGGAAGALPVQLVPALKDHLAARERHRGALSVDNGEAQIRFLLATGSTDAEIAQLLLKDAVLSAHVRLELRRVATGAG